MANRLTVEIADDGDILVSVGALIALPIVGVSKMSITKWINAGLPFEQKGKRRLFPISKAVKWMIESGKIDIKVESLENMDRDKLPPDLRDKLASAELKEFRLRRERELVVEKDEVERQAFEIGRKTKEALKTISLRFAEQLANISDAHKIRKILDEEVAKILIDLSEEIDRAV